MGCSRRGGSGWRRREIVLWEKQEHASADIDQLRHGGIGESTMKRLSYPLTCASLAFLAASANAQQGGFHTPTTCFVYSQGSRSIRPLVGIPGAAYPGPAVLNDVNGAWIAPGGKWAFVTRADHPAF